MTVRIAEESDAYRLTLLVADFRRFYHAAENMQTCNEFVKARLAGKDSLILVAEDKGELCGYAQLFPSFSTIALEEIFILNDLFVSPNYRGRGVSDLLLTSVADHSKLFKKKLVWLLTSEDNTIAQNLYSKHSFKSTKFKHYVRTIQD